MVKCYVVHIVLALALYFKCSHCYRFLWEIFASPTSRMIWYWLHKICFTVGLNDSVFKLLKRKTSMKPQDKVCGIVFDAISIKLDYITVQLLMGLKIDLNITLTILISKLSLLWYLCQRSFAVNGSFRIFAFP